MLPDKYGVVIIGSDYRFYVDVEQTDVLVAVMRSYAMNNQDSVVNFTDYAGAKVHFRLSAVTCVWYQTKETLQADKKIAEEVLDDYDPKNRWE